MYAVKISGTQTVFGFMRIQIKKKTTSNCHKTTSFHLLCQQLKSSYNINVAFTYHVLHYVCSVVIPYTCSPSSASARQIVYQKWQCVTLVYRICILHRFLVIVFNLKLDVFCVLQPSHFFHFSSFFLSCIIYAWDR